MRTFRVSFGFCCCCCSLWVDVFSSASYRCVFLSVRRFHPSHSGCVYFSHFALYTAFVSHPNRYFRSLRICAVSPSISFKFSILSPHPPPPPPSHPPSTSAFVPHVCLGYCLSLIYIFAMYKEPAKFPSAIRIFGQRWCGPKCICSLSASSPVPPPSCAAVSSCPFLFSCVRLFHESPYASLAWGMCECALFWSSLLSVYRVCVCAPHFLLFSFQRRSIPNAKWNTVFVTMLLLLLLLVCISHVPSIVGYVPM